MGVCADRTAGPLTIAQGQAQYTTATGYQLTGPVGPQGQLAMRSLTPPGSNGYQPLDIIVNGRDRQYRHRARPPDQQLLQL